MKEEDEMARMNMSPAQEQRLLRRQIEMVVDRHGTGFKSTGKTIAQTLRHQRYWFGLGQREVATLAGIATRTYQDWENGKSVPQPGWRLLSVALVLHIPPSALGMNEKKGARPKPRPAVHTPDSIP